MVNLLRFYETEAAIYLLLQHVSGGKLWNYISGYVHQHNETHLEDVLNDAHERNLRTHNQSVENDLMSKTVVASNGSTDEVTSCNVDVKGAKGTVTFSLHSCDTSTVILTHTNEICNRQESTTEVDSLLDDSRSIDKTRQTSDIGKNNNLSLEAYQNIVSADKTASDHDSQNFFDVLKAADTSVKAFSINSFDSDVGVGSRLNSTTSDHGIESIPEVQFVLSSPHMEHEDKSKLSDGDGFNTATSDRSVNGAKVDNAQTDICGESRDLNFDTRSTIRGAETAIRSKNISSDKEDINMVDKVARERSTSTSVPLDDINFVLPGVPIENLESSDEEVSIYDRHKRAESGSESSSPERPMHVLFDKEKPDTCEQQ